MAEKKFPPPCKLNIRIWKKKIHSKNHKNKQNDKWDVHLKSPFLHQVEN
jgi:hypothetical protein